MRHARFTSAIGAAAFALTGLSAAQDEVASATADPAGATDAPAHTISSQPRLHDGLYLRLASGFGAYNERVDRPGQESYVSVMGIAETADVAAGYAIRPGVVLGGGFWSTNVLASSTRSFDGEVATSSTSQNPTSWVFGPWLDYYFDPRGGLHVPAGLGLAFVNGLDVRNDWLSRNNTAHGAGLLVGLGYEWWISEQWSIGVLGRATAVAATSQDSEGRSWFHLVGSAPSILFSVTYN